MLAPGLLMKRPPPSENPASGAQSGSILWLPGRWQDWYDGLVARNAGQVSQVEAALRSLTYIIPYRFRDAELASESIHTSVQLLSLYHDAVLRRSGGSGSAAAAPVVLRTPHARYTRHWAGRSTAYARAAVALQVVSCAQLLCEMAARRRAGDRARWRVVLLIEAVKALCRLVMLRATRGRALVTPPLPERGPAVNVGGGDSGHPSVLASGSSTSFFAAHVSPTGAECEFDPELGEGGTVAGGADADGFPSAEGWAAADDKAMAHLRAWAMPRTGSVLPGLPGAEDITSYLLAQVLTADDIRPAAGLLRRLGGSVAAAEVLQAVGPLVYAAALAGSRRQQRRGWAPWLLGVSVAWAAWQLREREQARRRVTGLERDEWSRRGWEMGWWAMRGPFYDAVVGPAVRAVRARAPGFVGGVLDDYDRLWSEYYFSTATG